MLERQIQSNRHSCDFIFVNDLYSLLLLPICKTWTKTWTHECGDAQDNKNIFFLWSAKNWWGHCQDSWHVLVCWICLVQHFGKCIYWLFCRVRSVRWLKLLWFCVCSLNMNLPSVWVLDYGSDKTSNLKTSPTITDGLICNENNNQLQSFVFLFALILYSLCTSFCPSITS